MLNMGYTDISDLPPDLRDRVKMIIGLVRLTSERVSETADDVEVYGYPIAAGGVAWGINGPDGPLIYRGLDLLFRLYTARLLPRHWIVADPAGVRWLVPAVSEGWKRRWRLPFNGRFLRLIEAPYYGAIGLGLPVIDASESDRASEETRRERCLSDRDRDADASIQTKPSQTKLRAKKHEC